MSAVKNDNRHDPTLMADVTLVSAHACLPLSEVSDVVKNHQLISVYGVNEIYSAIQLLIVAASRLIHTVLRVRHCMSVVNKSETVGG